MDLNKKQNETKLTFNDFLKLRIFSTRSSNNQTLQNSQYFDNSIIKKSHSLKKKSNEKYLTLNIKDQTLFINNFSSNIFHIKKPMSISNNQNTSSPKNFDISTNSLIDSSKTIQIKQYLMQKLNLSNSVIHKLKDPLFECFICNSFPQAFTNTKIYSSKECTHYFCNNCGKNYYEEKIELGIFNEECPKYFCNKKVSLDVIKMLISKEYFNLIQKKNNGIYQELNPLSSKNYFLEKHMLDIVKEENFYFKEYIKVKNIICINCHQASIFGRNCREYAKCLNCGKSICKYCFKEYTADHLNIRSLSHCKIFFRINRNKKTSMYQNKLHQFFFFLIGFFVLILGMSIKINDYITLKLNCRVIYYLTFIVIFCIVILIFLILLPFYPMIVIIIG